MDRGDRHAVGVDRALGGNAGRACWAPHGGLVEGTWGRGEWEGFGAAASLGVARRRELSPHTGDKSRRGAGSAQPASENPPLALESAIHQR